MPTAKSLARMLDRGRDDALLRYALGGAYLAEGDAASAVTHLRAAVAHDPGYSAAWKVLGKALVETGALDDARTAYSRGIAAAERHGDAQAAKEMTVFRRRVDKTLAAKDVPDR